MKKIMFIIWSFTSLSLVVVLIYDYIYYSYMGNINNNPIIAYDESEIDSGIAEIFLIYLNERKYSKAYAMYHYDANLTQYIENPLSYERTHKEMKDFWYNTIARGHKVVYSKPGIEELEHGIRRYTFPMNNTCCRFAMNIYTYNEKILDFDMALIDGDEKIYYSLMQGDINKTWQNENDDMQDFEAKWKEVMAITGEYISTRPPKAYTSLDFSSITFTTKFQNGMFDVNISCYQLSPARFCSISKDNKLIFEGELYNA